VSGKLAGLYPLISDGSLCWVILEPSVSGKALSDPDLLWGRTQSA
jgi:hypothetical protein